MGEQPRRGESHALPKAGASDAPIPTNDPKGGEANSLQKFASAHASFHNHFALKRHLVDRQTFKQRRSAAWAEWQSPVG